MRMSIRSEARVRAWTAVLFLSLAAPAARAQSGLPPAVEQVVGQPVAAVRVVGETGNVIEQDPIELPLRRGQAFTLETERDTLRQLFRSGQYGDVTAQASAIAGGVQIDFVVRPNFYINQVHVMGLKEPPSESVASSALRL